jgi:Mrp family chromosome partitioning ATPase
MTSKTVQLIEMILAKYGKEDEIEEVLEELKVAELVKKNLKLKVKKSNKSNSPKKPTAYNLFCFKEGFGKTGLWKESKLNTKSDNYDGDYLEEIKQEFNEKQSVKPEKKKSETKGASPYNMFVSSKTGSGLSFAEISVAWAKSNLNKKSEYFDADTLEAETKKYNEKKYSKK